MGRGHGLDCSDSGQEQVIGCCEQGDEPSSSIKCGEFFKLPVELLASAAALRSVRLVSTDRWSRELGLESLRRKLYPVGLNLQRPALLSSRRWNLFTNLFKARLPAFR